VISDIVVQIAVKKNVPQVLIRYTVTGMKLEEIAQDVAFAIIKLDSVDASVDSMVKLVTTKW
jgi:hypothetical protein